MFVGIKLCLTEVHQMMMMMMMMMMKPVSGDEDEVLNFLNTGPKNTELTIEKRYQMLPFLHILTPKTNYNRIPNIYTKFIDTGSRTNYFEFYCYII